MTPVMTTRERIHAVLRGDEVDRFPVWLKMANPTWRSSQPEPYASMDSATLLRACGCDVMLHCSMPGKALKARRPHVTIETERDGNVRRTITHTPDGSLVGENTLDAFTNSWHPTKFCAADRDDFRALRWCYADTEYSVDADAAKDGFEQQKRLAAEDVVTISGMGPSPLMHCVEHLCGPENSVYHMTDEPELFAEILDLMHDDNVRRLNAIMPHNPADTFWMSENTSTTLISPDMFRTYAMPCLAENSRIALANDVIPVHHMCGTLNALLEDIDSLPALANEAYTTRPLGNVSLAEGRTRMPSKALIGGTNATLWLEEPETIVATVAADLAACPDRRKIFLTSAGVLPPPVSFEKAKTVVRGLQSL